MPMDRAKMARLRDVVKVLAQLRTESKLKNLPVLPKQPTEVTAEKLMKALHRRLDDGAAKATLVEAWEKFTAPAGDAAGLAGPKAFRLQAAAALATWNGESYTVDDWDDFVTWTLAFVTTYKVWRWTITMELSLTSAAGRVHFHAMFEWRLSDAPDWPDIEHMKFKGSKPNVRPNYLAVVDGLDGVADKKGAPRGLHVRQSLDAGHFYCFMEKPGSVKSDTNYPPFQPGGYCPTGRRLVCSVA